VPNRSEIETNPLPPDVVLRVRHVSKKFCRHLRRSMWYGIQDLGRNLIGRPAGLMLDGKRGLDRFANNSEEDTVAKGSCHGKRGLDRFANGSQQDTAAKGSCRLFPQTDGQRSIGLRPHEFWALQDINVDVRRGEVLGLIGMNGCGKTTLLRLIAGIFPPDLGEIAIRGRTGALIALGAGFHPHMTGRENVYLNAAILGLSRQEIRDRFQAIIDFAEIGPFIDAPVSTYSSGMRVKLGFAIAINVQADLLLIDEVLAVGDIGFKIKCLNAIRGILNNTAVVFVSHSMNFISQFCTRVLLLSQGQAVCDTPSAEVGIDRYLELFPQKKLVSGTGDAVVENLVLSNGKHSWRGDQECSVQQGDPLTVRFDLTITNPGIREVTPTVDILDQGLDPIIIFPGTTCATANQQTGSAKHHITAFLGKMDLNGGKYTLNIYIHDSETKACLARVQGIATFRVRSGRVYSARVVRSPTITISSE
jgi:lipopolysaccharide transport system ATP-binding protein